MFNFEIGRREWKLIDTIREVAKKHGDDIEIDYNVEEGEYWLRTSLADNNFSENLIDKILDNDYILNNAQSNKCEISFYLVNNKSMESKVVVHYREISTMFKFDDYFLEDLHYKQKEFLLDKVNTDYGSNIVDLGNQDAEIWVGNISFTEWCHSPRKALWLFVGYVLKFYGEKEIWDMLNQ